MPQISGGLLIVLIALIGLPIFLGLCLAVYLYEKAHGGQPLSLTPGMDFKKMGMLA